MLRGLHESQPYASKGNLTVGDTVNVSIYSRCRDPWVTIISQLVGHWDRLRTLNYSVRRSRPGDAVA